MQEDARNTILILKNYDGQDLGEFRHNLATFGAVKVREDVYKRQVYEEANQKAAGAVKRGGNTPATPAPETTDTPTTAPRCV